MTHALRSVLVAEQWAILAYFVAVNAFLVVVLIASGLEMRRHLLESWHESRWRVLSSAAAPAITLLAPAYNEALTVSESLRSLLTLSYPNLEVVVINDGSSDDTVAVLQRDFDLVEVLPIFQRRVQSAAIRHIYRSRTSPGLVVVDKDNGGKADALNAGMNIASGELVCAIDADTIIESDALLRMVRPFLYRNDVVAAGGTIRVVNGSRVRGGRVIDAHAPHGALPALQAVEYLRAFLTGRLAGTAWGATSSSPAPLASSAATRCSPPVDMNTTRSERTWNSLPACDAAHMSTAVLDGFSSSPIRWPGPRYPTRCASWDASAIAGTAGSPTCSGATAMSSGAPAMAVSV